MQDIVAGRVDYICIDIPGVISLIQSGQIKALAVLSASRAASLPDVPTAQEQGLKGFEAANWAAFFMPKGTPAPIVARLQAASSAAVDADGVKKRMKDLGIDPVGPDRRSSAYLGKFVAGEIDKWAGPVKASGLTTD
jgi:tripartite-type tricarboxylate transporter receptor subunit TctC